MDERPRRSDLHDAVDQVLFVEAREVDAAGRAGDLEVGDGAGEAGFLLAAQGLGLPSG
jgi:hypothetical protein